MDFAAKNLVQGQLETSEEFVFYYSLEHSHEGISVALRASGFRPRAKRRAAAAMPICPAPMMKVSGATVFWSDIVFVLRTSTLEASGQIMS